MAYITRSGTTSVEDRKGIIEVRVSTYNNIDASLTGSALFLIRGNITKKDKQQPVVRITFPNFDRDEHIIDLDKYSVGPDASPFPVAVSNGSLKNGNTMTIKATPTSFKKLISEGMVDSDTQVPYIVVDITAREKQSRGGGGGPIWTGGGPSTSVREYVDEVEFEEFMEEVERVTPKADAIAKKLGVPRK